MKKYLIDTSIWVDLRENRKSFNKEPLGDYAFELFKKIIVEKDKIVITDYIQRELESNYKISEIKGMFLLFRVIIEKIIVSEKQREEAKKISEKRKVPKGDALHAIIARDNKLVMITRDNHFRILDDISKHYKPEELI